ncbi:hypothetical protein RUM43_011165 [Polyplax serrata]|uniref:Uncharacterized protein n=1 Tax=Polyplax serrata TaxID=468196 RepID=A0AAN8S0V6_POLSC
MTSRHFELKRAGKIRSPVGPEPRARFFPEGAYLEKEVGNFCSFSSDASSGKFKDSDLRFPKQTIFTKDGGGAWDVSTRKKKSVLVGTGYLNRVLLDSASAINQAHLTGFDG